MSGRLNNGQLYGNWVAKGDETGAPLLVIIDYACSVRCVGVVAFGLSGP